jgi:ABC-type transport system involved in multi-copper enzyme maturation permease subunit
MNSRDTLKLLAKDASLYQSFSQLDRVSQSKVGWEILRSQAVILFSKKFAWFIAGLMTYFVTAYIINYRQAVINRMTQEDILFSLLVFPLFILAIFLNMQLISSEKDKRTLEVLFTTAGSRYKVWILRVATLNLMLVLTALALSTLAFFSIADISIVPTALHGFVPAFLIGGVTLYFSVKFRSGLAAGMVTAIIVVLTIMFSDGFNLEDTRYFLFFNPYDVPRELDPETWNIWMWQNRIGILGVGTLLHFFALRGLELRERILR